MNPKEWRERKGWTQEQLAAKLGVVGRGAVHRYETGSRRPAEHIMERYYLLSAGAVTPSDFYPLQRWGQRLHAIADAACAALLGRAA